MTAAHPSPFARAPRPLVATLTFALLAVVSTAALFMVVDRWGEPRTFDGSTADLVLSASLVVSLLLAAHRHSTSPLRTPIVALLIVDTLIDSWRFSALGSGGQTNIGVTNLAVEVVWLVGIAFLALDRPAATDATRSTSEGPRP